MKTLGISYLLGYIVLVGIASFLQKFAMKSITPYQINFLMAIGMAITAIPALWLVQKNLHVAAKDLPLGLTIGFMMAVGSIAYVLALSKLPLGVTAAVSSSYLVVVVILSWIFLHESFSLWKIIGVVLTLVGAAILSVVA